MSQVGLNGLVTPNKFRLMSAPSNFMFSTNLLRSFIALLVLVASSARAIVVINQTDNASQIGAYSARVGAKVSAGNESATWVIEYGTTTNYGMKSLVVEVDENTYTQSFFSITGMKPNTLYHYRCKATGSTGIVVVGPDKTFTTGPHEDVVVTEAPTSRGGHLIALGDRLDLEVTEDSGSYPFTYQWKRNGANRGAALPSSYFSIRNVTAADGGTWTCEVKNPGSKTTTPGTLITIVTPAGLNKTVAEGGTITPSVTLSPPNPNAIYRWYKQESSLTDIGSVSGSDTSKLTVKSITPEAGGDYYCEVTLGTEVFPMYVGELDVGLKPVISPIANQTIRVGQPVSITVDSENSPASITVSALPAGLTYSATNRTITGKPATATPVGQSKLVSIFGTNAYGKGQTISFNYTVNELDPKVVGTFDGIIQRSADTKNLGGKIRATITSTGAISGSVTLGDVVYNFRSFIEASLSSDEVSLYLPAVTSGKNPPLALSLYMNDNGLSGNVSSSMGYGQITGYRGILNKLNHNASKGPYNTRFSPQSGQLADPAYPHGHSFASFNVSDLGVVTVAGRMADGTAITASTSFGPAGQMPIFLALYKGNGSILGTPVVTGTDVAGDLSWSKNLPAAGRAYGSGFAAHDLFVEGRLYTKPNVALGQRFLGLGSSTNNAQLAFTEATLTAPLLLTFTVNASSKPALPSPNPNALSVTLNAATGLVNGTFKATDANPVLPGRTVTRPGTWYGLVIPNQGKALGFFTIPDLPASGPPASLTGITANPVQSGIAELSAPTSPGT